MDRTQHLVPWLRANGVVWEPYLVLEEPITRVIAAQDLHVYGLVVARVPKVACLTRLTCSDRAKALLLALQTETTKNASEEAPESASGWCMPLALMLMVEQSLGSESAYAPYISALPERTYVPIMWSPDERQFLTGTEVQEAMQDEWEAATREWWRWVQPVCKGDSALGACHLARYLAARSLITSRAFRVDAVHGEGLVPLADLFNHSTGSEHVHFVDEAGKQPCASSNNTEVASGAATSASDWLEIDVFRQVDRGEEVLSTYGPLANTQLLNYYGFTQDANPEDYVQVSASMLRAVCALQGMAGQEIRERTAWAVDVGLVSSSDKTFRFKRDGVPPEDLVMLAGLYHLPKNTVAAVQTELQALSPGEEYEEIDGSYVFDKRTMRVGECIYQHASDSKKLLKSATRDTTLSVDMACTKSDEVGDLGLGEDETLLLTPQVCSTLLEVLTRREALYPPSSSLLTDIQRLQHLVVETGTSQGVEHSALRVRIGEREVIAAAKSYIESGWGWKLPKDNKSCHGSNGNAVDCGGTTKAAQDDAWGLFD